MNDDFEPEITAALRTLQRAPEVDGRAAVARRVARRRMQRVGAATFAIVALGLGTTVVVTRDETPSEVATDTTRAGSDSGSGSTTPPATGSWTPNGRDDGVGVFPAEIRPGATFRAVLRNPTDQTNAACFVSVRLERRVDDQWAPVGDDIVADGVDPNLVGPGADCAPDVLLPGTFIGERSFTVPDDLAAGQYRVVEVSTELAGFIDVKDDPRVAVPDRGEYSVDLTQGDELAPVAQATLERAVLLDDNRLAIAWDSACNAPAQRVDFVYDHDLVVAMLRVGSFLVTDCVGEPTTWSTVVDLPAPIWGRRVHVKTDLNNFDAERVDVAPISTVVLPGVAASGQSAPIVGTSIFRQHVAGTKINVAVFGADCLDNAQSMVFRAESGEVFVQAHVQLLTDFSNPLCDQQSSWRDIQVMANNLPSPLTLFGPDRPY